MHDEEMIDWEVQWIPVWETVLPDPYTVDVGHVIQLTNEYSQDLPIIEIVEGMVEGMVENIVDRFQIGLLPPGETIRYICKTYYLGFYIMKRWEIEKPTDPR